MADYRLFCFDDEGKLVLADWVSAESDEGAITAARVIKDASKVEVWQSDHLIATVQDGRAIYGEPRPIM